MESNQFPTKVTPMNMTEKAINVYSKLSPEFIRYLKKEISEDEFMKVTPNIIFKREIENFNFKL